MSQAAALTICATRRYFPAMSKGRPPIGPRGPYPNRILVLRTVRKLTQAQLGEMIGVQGPYLGKLEKGLHKLTDESLAKLCEALQCDPWEVDPARFHMTDEDVQALTINRMLLSKDPARRERWIGAGEDSLKAIEKP